MNKTKRLLLPLIMALCLVFTACGSVSSDSPQTNAVSVDIVAEEETETVNDNVVTDDLNQTDEPAGEQEIPSDKAKAAFESAELLDLSNIPNMTAHLILPLIIIFPFFQIQILIRLHLKHTVSWMPWDAAASHLQISALI